MNLSFKTIILVVGFLSYATLTSAFVIQKPDIDDIDGIGVEIPTEEFSKQMFEPMISSYDFKNHIQSDEPWVSDWAVSTITSIESPEIGATYIQIHYDSVGRPIIRNVWQYSPGFAMYKLPQETGVIDVYLDEISHGGWILKEENIIENVESVDIKNGEIVGWYLEDDVEFHELSNETVWDKTHSLNYSYEKNEQGEWKLTLNIKDEIEDNIISSLDLEKQQDVNIQDVQDVDSLIDMITYEPDEIVRQRIIDQIYYIGNEKDSMMADNISNLLYNEDAHVRERAAELLGTDTDKRALVSLGIALKIDENFSVKSEIIWAVGKIGGLTAIDILKRTLDDPLFGEQAAEALGEIGEPAKDLLMDILVHGRSAMVIVGAIRAVSEMGNEVLWAVEPLMKLLSSRNLEVRGFASWALGKIGNPEPLLERLDDEDPNVRQGVALALGWMGETAKEQLLEELSNENRYRRMGAAYALSEMEPPPVEELIEALGDPLPYRKEAVLNSLIWIGEPAVELLMQAVTHSNPYIREGAVVALGKIGKPAIESLVEDGLNSENLETKELISMALVMIGIPAMEAVFEFFGYEIPEEFNYQYITNKLIDILKEDSLNRENAIFLLAKIGDPAIKPLLGLFNEPNLKNDSNFLEVAKRVLVLIGNPSFIPVVKELLNSKEPAFKQMGLEIIQEIGKKSGLEELDSTLDFKNLELINQFEIALNTSQAVAISSINETDFFKNYIFNETDGMLYIKDDLNISKLEMATILDTGIPGDSDWWNNLANKDEKIKYLELFLGGDFIDERLYIVEAEKKMFGEGRVWLCVQFATQLIIDFMGYREENFADKEIFEEYGPGYVFHSMEEGYGIPIYYATTSRENGSGHAFGAVFVGDGELNDNIEDWIFIEPQDDDFSPNLLCDEVIIYLNPFFLPDGQVNQRGRSGGNYLGVEKIYISTEGYHYGGDNW